MALRTRCTRRTTQGKGRPVVPVRLTCALCDALAVAWLSLRRRRLLLTRVWRLARCCTSPDVDDRRRGRRLKKAFPCGASQEEKLYSYVLRSWKEGKEGGAWVTRWRRSWMPGSRRHHHHHKRIRTYARARAHTVHARAHTHENHRTGYARARAHSREPPNRRTRIVSGPRRTTSGLRKEKRGGEVQKRKKTAYAGEICYSDIVSLSECVGGVKTYQRA